jgi:hypothetical protein
MTPDQQHTADHEAIKTSLINLGRDNAETTKTVRRLDKVLNLDTVDSPSLTSVVRETRSGVAHLRTDNIGRFDSLDKKLGKILNWGISIGITLIASALSFAVAALSGCAAG